LVNNNNYSRWTEETFLTMNSKLTWGGSKTSLVNSCWTKTGRRGYKEKLLGRTTTLQLWSRKS